MVLRREELSYNKKNILPCPFIEAADSASSVSYTHLDVYKRQQLYPYYYAKTFYDGLKASGEDEIISLTRAAYPGSQKFGAIVWNGDIRCV